jgi:hypothetical protein
LKAQHDEAIRMNIEFSGERLPKSGVIVLFATDGAKLTKAGEDLNKSLSGKLSDAMTAVNYEGNKDQVLDIVENLRPLVHATSRCSVGLLPVRLHRSKLWRLQFVPICPKSMT